MKIKITEDKKKILIVVGALIAIVFVINSFEGNITGAATAREQTRSELGQFDYCRSTIRYDGVVVNGVSYKKGDDNPNFPCSVGEGDCEKGQCEAGLKCVNNVGKNYGWQGSVDVCEGETHAECRNGQCVEVVGSGSDQCSDTNPCVTTPPIVTPGVPTANVDNADLEVGETFHLREGEIAVLSYANYLGGIVAVKLNRIVNIPNDRNQVYVDIDVKVRRNTGELIYTQNLGLNPDDIGFAVEVLKMGENRALLNVPANFASVLDIVL